MDSISVSLHWKGILFRYRLSAKEGFVYGILAGFLDEHPMCVVVIGIKGRIYFYFVSERILLILSHFITILKIINYLIFRI